MYSIRVRQKYLIYVVSGFCYALDVFMSFSANNLMHVFTFLVYQFELDVNAEIHFVLIQASYLVGCNFFARST